MSNSFIWPIMRTLSGVTTQGQSGPASNGNEEVFRIPQIPSITQTSLSDCLVSYPEHSLVVGVLPLCKNAVGLFYSPRRLGCTNFKVAFTKIEITSKWNISFLRNNFLSIWSTYSRLLHWLKRFWNFPFAMGRNSAIADFKCPPRIQTLILSWMFGLKNRKTPWWRWMVLYLHNLVLW